MPKITVRHWLRASGGKHLAGMVVIAALIGLFGWRLGSLTPGVSSSEVAAVTRSSSLERIADNPLFAPHKLLQLAAQQFNKSDIWTVRLPSVIFALAAIGCLYYILNRWFGRTIAGLATAIAAVTPWFVLLGRDASPNIMFMAPVFIGASVLWLQKAKRWRKLAFYTMILVVGMSLYVPGLVWLILAALALKIGPFRQILKDINRYQRGLGVVLLLILLIPLIKAGVDDWSVARSVLALPEHWPSVLAYIKSLGWSVLAIGWKAPYHSDWYLGRLPALDIMQSALVAFGLYAMYSLARPKAQLLVAILGIGLFIEALNSNTAMFLLAMPVLFVLLAAGLRYLYFEWHGVFPFNPIPRIIALSLISLVVGIHIVYGVRYSLIAWPGSSDTLSSYRATIER